MTPKSADGRGRTLWELLTKRNQGDMRPLELQYHNPLSAKVGCTISFDHEPEISGINFVVEKISVYETKIGVKKFYHTDYHLKGVSLEQDAPVRSRLRLIPDEETPDKLGHKIQLLDLYHEMTFDKAFVETTLADPTGEFHVLQDDEGNPLEIPRKYWRVEDVLDPYHAKVTILKDVDGDGTVEENELEHELVTYYDYSRLTEDEAGGEVIEFLTIEMNEDTGYLTFLRGKDILPSQVTVY